MPQLAILIKSNGVREGGSEQEAWNGFRNLCGHLKL